MAFLFFIFINFSHFALADQPCEINDTFADLKQLSENMAPVVALSATQNVEDFCRVNALRDFQEIATGADATWYSNFIAAHDARETNFLKRLSSPEAGDAQINVSPTSSKSDIYQSEIDKLNNYPTLIPQVKIKSFNKALQGFRTWPKDQESQTNELGMGTAAAACVDLQLKSSVHCAKGLMYIKSIALPIDGVMFDNLWSDAVNDPKYMAAFKNVALKIVTHLKDKTVPKTDMFTDFKNAFLDLTKDEKAAQEYAWKTMAILASGGAQSHMRTDKIGMPISELDGLIYLVSNGSLVLDRLAVQSGSLYTYPKEVPTKCDNGKNYHFWMSAYLAREAAKKTGSVDGGAAAAFTAEKGYQFMKEGHGRDPSRVFKDETFSNSNNNMRLDLSLSAAGAWYGAKSLDRKPTQLKDGDIDNSIRETFKDSKMVPRKNFDRDEFREKLTDPVDAAGVYYDWKKIINPDGAFNYLRDKFE